MGEPPAAPAEIRWLVDLVGEPTAAQLIATHGGTRMTLPRSVSPGSKIAQAIGLEPACRLVAHLGGNRAWKVPSMKRWRVQLLRAGGKKRVQIARALGLDESTVDRYLAHRTKAPATAEGIAQGKEQSKHDAQAVGVPFYGRRAVTR